MADNEKAIQLDPQDADPFNGRGNVYYTQGKLDLALADYEKAIQLDPKNEVFHRNLKLVKKRMGID